jgi:glycosyltransferase involved in cell wall biosynthesis
MPVKLPLSAFIICLNEEAYLGNCIESLESCAEIVIIDSGSTDGTAALVQSYIDKGWPIRFLFEPWRGYAGQKQFALDQCSRALVPEYRFRRAAGRAASGLAALAS